MVFGYKIKSPFQKENLDVTNPLSLKQNLEELGFTTYQLNDKDMRVEKVDATMKRLQELDTAWRTGTEEIKIGKQTIKLTFQEYVIRRCGEIALLAHVVAVPNGRGGDDSIYAQKIINFNVQLGEFQNWLDNTVVSVEFLNLIYQESLSIVGYSWKEKDITVQKILVYMNPMGGMMRNSQVNSEELDEAEKRIDSAKYNKE